MEPQPVKKREKIVKKSDILVEEYLKVKGLANNHLNSFNYFTTTGIKKIIQLNSLLSCSDPTVYLRYKDVRIRKLRPGLQDPTPHTCRLSHMTYSAPIHVDIEYTNGSRDNWIIHTKTDVNIGFLPIMLKSSSCMLHDLDEDDLARYDECPLDPGGYFIIKGTEKVILMQEQLSKNRIFIDTDMKGCVRASISNTVMTMEEEKIYLHLSQFTSKVPIMIVLKAMGMESDQEVFQMIGRDPPYKDLLLPSIEDCERKAVHTQHQARRFLEQKVKRNPSEEDKEGRALNILRDTLLANVPVPKDDFRPKCIYVAVMIRRMMEAILNKDSMDDKDHMGNKRVELSGQSLALLFEDLFMSMNDEARRKIDRLINKQNPSSLFDISKCLDNRRITDGIERAISTGNWHIPRFQIHRQGATQVVNRLSPIGTLGMMTMISFQPENSRIVSVPRALHCSERGMLCPYDTPEGGSWGAVKNLALMTHVTTHDEDEGSIISLCYSNGVKKLEMLSAEELHMPSSYLIIFNGLILGKHRMPHTFSNSMRKLRRAGKIGEFVSISVNEKQLCVYIASDIGRVCRPLVIADKGVSRIKDHHMTKLNDGKRTFQSFVEEGLIEYLDANEANNSLISPYKERTTEYTTHIEIEPFTTLGVYAGLIPYLDQNNSSSNTRQCSMGKRAMGCIAYNQLCRMDSNMNLLVYPQRPLLTTRTIELVHYDKLGAGQNAIVAVMSYGSDAILLNKSSLDRGFGRCIEMKTMSAVVHKNERDGPDAEQMQILDDCGIAAPGEIIRPSDVYINKQSPKVTGKGNLSSQYESSRQTYSSRVQGVTTVVDRVTLCSDRDKNLSVKLMIRHTRRPEVGDKFSSRDGDEGVVGTIVQQEDLPFSDMGVCPDIIISPRGFPSDVSLGMMMELLGSKAGVSDGEFHNGSAYGDQSGLVDGQAPTAHTYNVLKTMSETLVKHGFSYNGKDILNSGTFGEPLEAFIFMGPVYYQKLM